MKIGLRHEDKSSWERRTVISPENVEKLLKEHGITTVVQPSPTRIFPDADYEKAGAELNASLSACPVIFGLKEIPPSFFEPDKVYLFFSHTIKGQKHNMPMLRQMLNLGCSLIDYERIVNEKNQRLIFFGRYAGLAGMIDTLWALGKRFEAEGIETPFSGIRQAYHYSCLAEAEDAVREAGNSIQEHGLPPEITPLVTAFTGYGHVSNGAQEVFDLLPHLTVEPERVKDPGFINEARTDVLYKAVFKEADMVAPVAEGRPFDLQEYYTHPERYKSLFHEYLPHITVMVNAIYWDSRYPVLVTNEDLKKLFYEKKQPRFRVAGDITCDIEGSIQCTIKATQPDNPVYTVFPGTGTVKYGFFDTGLTVLPIDNFPAELPRESSLYFSDVLMNFIPEISSTDFSQPLDRLTLSKPLASALIMHKGELTPDYRYLEKHL
ncbi:hypothetical protein JXO52_03135 [bacterium]|nr:hypothetical protein [bacterium]